MVSLVRFELNVGSLLSFPRFGNSFRGVVNNFGVPHWPSHQLPVRGLRRDMVKLSGARYFRSVKQPSV